jgi:hypothetical protein
MTTPWAVPLSSVAPTTPSIAPNTSHQQTRISAPAASGEPRGSLDRGMRIVARRNWRWLRCRPGHPGWRHADSDNDPGPVTSARDPACSGFFSSPPFNLSDRLLTRHCPGYRCSISIIPAALTEGAGRAILLTRRMSAGRVTAPMVNWASSCVLGTVVSRRLAVVWSGVRSHGNTASVLAGIDDCRVVEDAS